MLQWINNFLQGRTTALKIVDFTSSQLSILISIPQSSPLSPILYLIYNLNINGTCTHHQQKSITSGFIDGIAILVRGTSAHSNLKTIYMHRQTKRWAAAHASVFYDERTTFKLTSGSSASVLKSFNTMSQAESSVIVQASMWKIELRGYLHLIGAEDSRNCPFGEEAQSVQ